MSPSATSDDVSLEARVRAEVERAILRNVKGLEYISAGDPPMGLTPRDPVYSRGTLTLYRYRPLAAEVYRTPVLLGDFTGRDVKRAVRRAVADALLRREAAEAAEWPRP